MASKTKRALDIVLSCLLIILLSPILCAAYLAVLIDDGRPVLFVQDRAGLNGTPFRILKFRTMINNAVQIGRDLRISDDPYGIVRDDPRITRTGKFLRRTGLDELPQLINVLRGQMSLVGPRPDLVEQAQHYSEADRRRLSVLPGMTGWSQVHGRDQIDWPERIAQDIWYIEHWSLRRDIAVLVKTFAQAFREEPDPVTDVLNIARATQVRNPSNGQLAEITPSNWNELLRDLGLTEIYYSHAYVQSAALIERGRPLLLHLTSDGGDVVYPFLLRRVPDDPNGAKDIITPYGYGGPMAVGDAPPIDEFHHGFAEWCSQHNVITSFQRFHPLLRTERFADPGTTLTELAGTIGWRLTTRDLLTGMHGKHRNMVRRAARQGVTVQMIEASSEPLRRFEELYTATMRRKGAVDYYFFPQEYWSLLGRELEPDLVFAEARLGGRLVASALLLRSKPWLHYHLGASRNDSASNGASTLLLYEAATWAQRRGFDIFHLGGGVGGRFDSLMEFKRRFDPGGVLTAFIGARVHDAERYTEMSHGRPSTGYFPIYRDPEHPAVR